MCTWAVPLYVAGKSVTDIAITKYKIAIFCDSEFFRGKDWEQLKSRLERGKKLTIFDKMILDSYDMESD